MRASERGRRLGQPAAPYSPHGARRERRARNLLAAPSLSSQASDGPTNLQSSGMQTRLLEPNAWVIRYEKLSQIRGKRAQGIALSSCSEWWAVLGSNQWPLPCETGIWGLRINDMRAVSSIATRTCYHVISLDITQCHDRTVPELSHRRFFGPCRQALTTRFLLRATPRAERAGTAAARRTPGWG